MPDNLDTYFDLAEGLIAVYNDRNDLFGNIDKMFYMDWSKPAGLPDWVLKVVSTDPHDAVLTTIRTFATLRPRFKILPMLPNEANRQRANEIETAITYNFHQAGRRNDSSVTWDVMFSASMYAEVAAQVVYLPYQEKILEAMGKDTRRVKAAKRFGDFAIIIHHPGNVYPEWSEYGLEGVLTIRQQTVDEFMDSWGALANKVVDEKDYMDGTVSYVTSFDYTNYEKRCVWGVLTDTTNLAIRGAGVKIIEEQNKLGFIPYAIRRWGNSLSTDPQRRVMPLLQSIYDSGQWDMLNTFDSLDASLAVKRAARVSFAGEFPPGQEPEIDNTEPEGVLKIPQGTRQFTPLPNQSPDMRVSQQKAELKGGIWQSTVSRALQTLEFPGGTAYSTVNQLLSTATNALSPYKILGQNTLAEVAHQMLCWLKYYGKEYNQDVSLYGRYDDKSRMGTQVMIPAREIDPDALQIEVILTPDMPVDKLQQVNGAVLIKQNFPIPDDELIEDLGYGDPAELTKRRYQQDFKTAHVNNEIRKIQLDTDMEYQKMQMEMQAGIQQQMQSQQMEQELAARQQEEAASAAANNESPAMENIGGLGNNPALGGGPPVQAARGQR